MTKTKRKSKAVSNTTRRKTASRAAAKKKIVLKNSSRLGRKLTTVDTDSKFFLKLILYFILGTLWIRLLHINIGPFQHFSLPIGLAIGLLLASKDTFQIDRRIEFAVLLIATFISFYLPVGVTI